MGASENPMIHLKPITPENHVEVRQLAVRTDQSHLIASVEKSLADAYVWSDSVFRVAYEDETSVGFVLVFPFSDDGKRIVNIVRLMIDARFQGRGLGRALLRKMFEWFRSFEPAVDRIRISTLPENATALALYKSEGFRERGEEHGEVVLYREL